MAIRIYGLGLDVETDERLFSPVDEEALGRFVLGGLERNAEEFAATRHTHSVAVAFRGEMERRSIDLGDPRAAGWTYLINAQDPRAEEWKEALQPLAEHRGMDRCAEPLLFDGEAEDTWHDWVLDILGPYQQRRPHYILIIGGPDQVPFALQSLLDSAASVGRVDFDSGEELRSYVDKLLRLEQAPEPRVSRRCLVFATDHGWPDPTWLSRRYLAQPISDRIRGCHGMEVEELVDFEASSERLLSRAAKASPAFVMTVGHGQFVSAEDEALRRRRNGAVVCQPGAGGARLLTGEDVAATDRFAEGAVFFHFACFGIGTPAVSGFSHWFEHIGDFVPARNSERDFTASLPRQLLAHPRGPVACVGHVDVACLHGFDDAEDPLEVERTGKLWHDRLAPFTDALDRLLAVQPVGLALETMNKRFDLANGVLTRMHDRLRSGAATESPEFLAKLANTFILRSDAQNYMVLGDPAARLRIPRND